MVTCVDASIATVLQAWLIARSGSAIIRLGDVRISDVSDLGLRIDLPTMIPIRDVVQRCGLCCVGGRGLRNGSDCTTCLDPSFPRTACVRSSSGTLVCMYSTVTYNCEQLQPADLLIYSTPVYSANTILLILSGHKPLLLYTLFNSNKRLVQWKSKHYTESLYISRSYNTTVEIILLMI